MDVRRWLAPHWSETPLTRLASPIQRFVAQSQAGGVVLFAMTLLALFLANSPFVAQYAAVLDTHISVSVGRFALDESVLDWVNDGLMALFFFVVGLEIKREVLVGELSELRAAALPVLAATGGALVPACIYALLNMSGVGSRGWGIPMATDIAFTLGCLALVGSEVPFALKVFVTAAAIVDDFIAVLVIAVFFSGGINGLALGVGLATWAVLVLANLAGIRNLLVYAVLGVVVWVAFLQSGVHATIAGVLVALTIPARYRIDAPTFYRRASAILSEFEPKHGEARGIMTDESQQQAVIALEAACEHVRAPLQKAEHVLQGWVTFVIMPVFALANAGIAANAAEFNGQSLPMILGIVFGLTLGKPIGLVGTAWLATRFGVAALPNGVTWRAMLGTGLLAGIGFTMSIFVATLGLPAHLLPTAKLVIVVASLIAGVAGTLFLRRVLRAQPQQKA